MTGPQAAILAILGASLLLFLWGRWRHDMVAVAALIAAVAAGLVPAETAFLGLGHPAVVTVACILILSAALQSSGAVEILARAVLPRTAGPLLETTALIALAALLSGFMNNVGALALLMPLALQVAQRQNVPPGRLLMPIAFGSILGGMTTLIGTPPNLIVSGFRREHSDAGFGMFDFTPVGLSVALVGLSFVILFGRLLVPARTGAGAESFETGPYVTEAKVLADSEAVGKPLREIERILEDVDAQVIGLVRDGTRIPAPSLFREVRANDILFIEAEPEGLAKALSALGLRLEAELRAEAKPQDGASARTDAAGAIRSDEIVLMELAVLPQSDLVGRSAKGIRLRSRYGANLLAISRQGRRTMSRLRTTAFASGDLLLMQGPPTAIADFAARYGCVPLAERPLRIPDRRKALSAAAVMAASVVAAVVLPWPPAISFAGGVLALLALGLVAPRRLYDAVDWPVILLLGALIPVAGAMVTTGAAGMLAGFLLDDLARGNALVALALVLMVTMTLSDFMNNAATAAVMCPIAIQAADRLGASADAFLMAVAIGASCAFLTPIGHQNNTLILGPGGFRFGDYWRLGLPLEIIVIAVAVPLLPLVWPLGAQAP